MVFAKMLARCCAVWLAIAFSSALSLSAVENHEPALELKNIDQPPRVLKRVPPEYPRLQKQKGVTGEVVVQFIVTKKGEIVEAEVVESTNPAFNKAALNAVRQWKFSPGIKGGQPVNVRLRQPIEFNLTEAGRGRRAGPRPASKFKLPMLKAPKDLTFDTPPRIKKAVFAVYPYELLTAGTAGAAQAGLLIDTEGRLVEIADLTGTAPEFVNALRAMLETFEFEPALHKGKPARSWLGYAVRFDPKGGGDVPVNASAKEILAELAKEQPAIATGRELDSPPQPIFTKTPNYPRTIQDKSTAGEAQIEFFVDKDGAVQLPKIVSASDPHFGYAAVQAISTWRFKPVTKAGQPVITRIRVPMKFTPTADTRPAAAAASQAP